MALRLKSSNAWHALHGRDLDAIPEGFLEIDFFDTKTDAYARAIRGRIGFSQAAQGDACFRTSVAQKGQRTEVHSGRFRQYLN